MMVPSSNPARTSFDRALASSFAAWSGEDREAILETMSGSLRDSVAIDPAESREFALASLASEHAAEVRFDPSRVHPTWWIRALSDESESVKRFVAMLAPRAIAQAVRFAFGYDEESLRPDRPSDPQAGRWALSLWSERLVGGTEPGDDDPLVVRAIASADRHSIRRLLEAVAELKRTYDANPTPDTRFREQSREDIAAYSGSIYRDFSALGLVTLGRLLEEAEPFRARWAVQHLPYPVAKFVRSSRQGETHHLSRAELIAWEATILTLALENGTAQA